MVEDVPVRSIVRDEATRQIVVFVFSLIGGVIIVWGMRAAAKPDLWRTVKMRSALTVKRVASRAADKCQDVADRAATAYNKERF